MKSFFVVWAICFVSVVSPAPPARADFSFEASPASARLVERHASVAGSTSCAIDSVSCAGEFGSGVALADANADGHLDVVVALGRNGVGWLAGPLDGLEGGTYRTIDVRGRAVNGVALADFDRDGDLDLLISGSSTDGSSTNAILENSGDLTSPFSLPVPLDAGPLGHVRPHNTSSWALSDFDLDGFPDAFVTEWTSEPVECGQHQMRLFRNSGGPLGTAFLDVTEATGAHAATPDTGGVFGPYGFGAAFSDMDGDGWPELLVTSDFGNSKLLRNVRGVFTDITRTSGTGTDRTGMGSAVADVNQDGRLDWFVSAIFAEGSQSFFDGNRLYVQSSIPLEFGDFAEPTRVHATGWAWGAAFVDADNDGDDDLLVASGYNVEDQTEFADTPLHFFERVGGQFEQRSVGTFDALRQTRAVALADYDRDGRVDVVVTRDNDTPLVLHNTTQAGDYIRVRPRGSRSNFDGLGARVTVTRQSDGRRWLREIGSETHFLAQSERVAHVGLGSGYAASGGLVDVHVRFLGGNETIVTGVTPNQELVVLEPDVPPPMPAAQVTEAPDCDQDGRPDRCADDCNQNGLPDTCDLATGAADCNTNGVLDACEAALGFPVTCDAGASLETDASRSDSDTGRPDAGHDEDAGTGPVRGGGCTAAQDSRDQLMPFVGVFVCGLLLCHVRGQRS